MSIHEQKDTDAKPVPLPPMTWRCQDCGYIDLVSSAYCSRCGEVKRGDT